MSPRVKSALVASVAGLLLMALAVFAYQYVTETREEAEPKVPEVFVQVDFNELRKSPGHEVHGAARIECKECHEFTDGKVQKPKPDLCVSCHKDIASEVHETVKKRKPERLGDTPGCQSCHPFVPGDHVPGNNCLRCHGSGIGDLPPVGAHRQLSCLKCHKQHEAAKPTASGCVDCHGDRAAGHGEATENPSDQCLSCHSVHEGASGAADRCAECHSNSTKVTNVISPLEALGAGHTECTDCHAPHLFVANFARNCRDCHAGQETLAPKVDEHRNCRSCHDPHKQVDAAKARCSGCHDTVKTDHKGEAGSCVGCHSPHDTPPGKIAASCTKCHTKAGTEHAYHDQSLTCASCHDAHAVKNKLERSLCRKCHEKQTSLTAGTKGHRDCNTCHEGAAHVPLLPRKKCQDCHKDQTRTAPKGHDVCGDCHASHSAAQKRGVNCKSCHKEEAKLPHSRKVTCNDCHRAHGPKGVAKPPKCGSCHQTALLPGLHRIKEHKDCADCHVVHEQAPRGDRATCSTAACHKPAKYRKHEPKSKKCTGCHVFGTSAGHNR